MMNNDEEWMNERRQTKKMKIRGGSYEVAEFRQDSPGSTELRQAPQNSAELHQAPPNSVEVHRALPSSASP